MFIFISPILHVHTHCSRSINEYDIDGERILQIISLHHLRMKHKFPEATRSVLLSLDSSYINETWDRAVEHLAEACEWIKKLGATPKTQPPHGTLVSIAAALMCYPESLSKPEFSASLRRWYFSTTLATNPSPSNNYKIGDDFRRFCLFLETGTGIIFPKVFFRVDELIAIKHYADSRYKAIQALMRTTVREDLLTGNLLDGSLLEDHHIFPYSLNKSGLSKNKLDSIANKIIVSKSTNRNISNTNPDKYLADLLLLHKKHGNYSDLDRRLSDCFIPYKSSDQNFLQKMSKDSFDIFLNDRAAAIIDRIKSVVGDAWQEPSNDEEVNLEEDEFITT